MLNLSSSLSFYRISTFYLKMTSNQTKELKKKLAESQVKDIKMAWQHLNWEWRIILIVGSITIMVIFFKFGQWLVR